MFFLLSQDIYRNLDVFQKFWSDKFSLDWKKLIFCKLEKIDSLEFFLNLKKIYFSKNLNIWKFLKNWFFQIFFCNFSENAHIFHICHFNQLEKHFFSIENHFETCFFAFSTYLLKFGVFQKFRFDKIFFNECDKTFPWKKLFFRKLQKLLFCFFFL